MTLTKAFRIAPSLARLVVRENGSTSHTEGYYDHNEKRNAHVTIGPDGAFLDMAGEDRHQIPQDHAKVLMDVADRTIRRERSSFVTDGTVAHVDRYASAGIDVVTFEFDAQSHADRFATPAWVGEDVTSHVGYQGRALASGSPVDAPEVPLGDRSLAALLDVLDALRSRRDEREPAKLDRIDAAPRLRAAV